ncbi:MAG TPA: asparaginase [Candidatus Polarisedimenticolaceae bacterium]|nr:asparaginase [Candidatus Polarisedimenticolaceae bacterium]
MAVRSSVLMVFTGGTISMRVVPGRGAVPASGGREILEAVPGLAEIASVTFEDFDRLPGPHWTPARMLELAHRLDDRLAGFEFAGAVVTHGTDTIEETAYLLDLVQRAEVPVVLTGAMKTADDPEWDGPENLRDAVKAVTRLAGSGGGVWVTMHGTLHPARTVRKAHTDAFDAFRSSAATAPRERIATDRLEERVDLVTAAVGADARFLRHAVACGAKGIVVEAMGRGNVPPAMLDGVREAAAAGIPVVVASRCAEGGTSPRYGYEGGGVTLAACGALFAGDLTPPQARIKLMALLGSGADARAVRAAFSG